MFVDYQSNPLFPGMGRRQCPFSYNQTYNCSFWYGHPGPHAEFDHEGLYAVWDDDRNTD